MTRLTDQVLIYISLPAYNDSFNASHIHELK